jgi:hypothetical protein
MILAHKVHGSIAVDLSKNVPSTTVVSNYFHVQVNICVLIPTQVIFVNGLANLFTSYGNSWTMRPSAIPDRTTCLSRARQVFKSQV